MKIAALRQASDARLTMAAIGGAATLALYDELVLAPKPGLVTLLDNGSHDDMDALTFIRSLFALRHYFVEIAQAGRTGADFATLERCGVAAETRMLVATDGINTHRGAIFMLGLLCAAAGAASRDAPITLRPDSLRGTLRRSWGDALALRCQRPSSLSGGMAARRHGLRSASAEAALAFPVLFETAVPVLMSSLARGLTPQQARLDTLFHVMAVLDDSNLAHRGGLGGLRHAQCAAREFLSRGGAATSGGIAAAEEIARDFVARRLSPGGAADILAAACWVVRVCPAP